MSDPDDPLKPVVFNFGDAVIMALSLGTLAGVIYWIKEPFKRHNMNVFTHLILIMIVFALLSKYQQHRI